MEIIKEILRRAEIKARMRGVEKPLALIQIDSREYWRIFVTDKDGQNKQVDGGENTSDLFVLLNEVRGK